MPDLTKYFDKILHDSDKPIFEEAVKSASAGALRSAYVMTWISCAESLKRRFQEAQARDGNARQVAGEIQRREADHRSIDMYVLQKAKDYGFVTDTEFTVLKNIYEMRCIYGHPYEQEPSDEQLIHAAASVVDYVLSQPVRLKHGFAETVLTGLTTAPSYLDDDEEIIEIFAKEIVSKISPEIVPWFLNRYWGLIEPTANDPSMLIYFRRCKVISQVAIRTHGTEVFDENAWHQKVGEYPNTLIRILSSPKIFASLGRLGQDRIVGEAITVSQDRPSLLKSIEKLKSANALSQRQKTRFQHHIDSMPSIKLIASRLNLETCHNRLLKDLKSYDWYVQSPAVEFISDRGALAMSKLDDDHQVQLGRNVLQAAEGKERTARYFLSSFGLSDWPIPFLKGVLFECFVNDENQLRFKTRKLNAVLERLSDVDGSENLSAELVTLIESSVPKTNYLVQSNSEKVLSILKDFDWIEPVAIALKEKIASIPEEEEDDEFEEVFG